MQEMLKKLLTSELLNEETRTELAGAVEALKESVKAETAKQVRAELAEEWVTERDALVARLEGALETTLTESVSELKSDIERFRDLEVEFAGRLAEETSRLQAQADADRLALQEKFETEMEQLVDQMDGFLEYRLAEDVSALYEDIQAAKTNEFGRRIVEAFAGEFAANFINEDSVLGKLRAANTEVEALRSQLDEAKKEQEDVKRAALVEKLLNNLSGSKRDQMGILLRGVETSKLEESYNSYIGRVMKTDAAPLTEGVVQATTQLVTGNPEDTANKPTQISEEIRQMQRVAGII